MKKFLSVLFLGLVLASCSKYKLKQPCTLNLKTQFIPAGGGTGDNIQYQGSFKVTRFTFSGMRSEGQAVEIEQIPQQETLELSQGIDLGVTYDIPVGTYESFQLKVRLNATNSLELIKKSLGAATLPILIQFSEDLDLLFTSQGKSKELKKKTTYQATMVWDFAGLMAGINAQDLNTANTSVVNGVEFVVLNTSMNVNLFKKVQSNLNSSMRLKLE